MFTLAVQTVINYTYMYSCCVAYGLIGDDLTPNELRGLSGEEFERAVIMWQNKIQSKIASHRRLMQEKEHAGRRRSSGFSYSPLRPRPVTGRRAAFTCDQEAKEEEKGIGKSDGASFLGGQWMGLADDNWLSSEYNEDDSTWLSSVSCEDSSSSSSSSSSYSCCSSSSLSLWSSCSGDEGSWLSAGEEDEREEGEREKWRDAKREEVGVVPVIAAAPSSVKHEAESTAVCAAEIVRKMEGRPAVAAKAVARQRASPARAGKKSAAAAGSSRESVKQRHNDACSLAARKVLSRSPSLASTPATRSARVPVCKKPGVGVVARTAKASTQVIKSAQATAAAAPLNRSPSLPCPPCQVGGMRMVHGSRSPELLATAAQAAKVAAIVKGGRQRAVSEEERARREARRERAAAALRESHMWEKERWDSGAACVRLSILRKTKSI